MPVLIDEDEWRRSPTGLIQRADLLERVVADLYGENRLVADGHLPRAADRGKSANGCGRWSASTPRSGHFLHFVAFDIGRGPDGDWWVLGDRTQAPSGAGFALENRIATARVFADLYADAPMFTGWRASSATSATRCWACATTTTAGSAS